jgi:hypothetical protein
MTEVILSGIVEDNFKLLQRSLYEVSRYGIYARCLTHGPYS